jgi:hypothetical protein
MKINKKTFSDIYWMQKQGKKTMEMTETPHHDYPDKKMHLIRHHYNRGSKSVSSESIMNYLRVSMFGCYNIETKNDIDTLASDGVTFGIQARSREYITARNLFDNELLVVTHYFAYSS